MAWTAATPAATALGEGAHLPARHASVSVDVEKDWLDRTVAAAQIATALAAVLTLPVITFQLIASRRQERMQHTTAILARWESREFRRLAAPVVAFLEGADAADRVEKLMEWERVPHSESAQLPGTPGEEQAPRPSKNDVYNVLNFFEDLGLRYNQRQIAREPVVRSIGPYTVELIAKWHWFIHYSRKGLTGKEYPLYRDWELMAGHVRRGRSRWGRWRRIVPWRRARQRSLDEIFAHIKALDVVQPARVMCLPPAAPAGSERDWWLAKRLSLVLTAPAAQDRFLAGSTAADESGEDGTGWRAFVIPRTFDADDEELADDKRRAEEFKGRLDGLSRQELERLLQELERDFPPA